MVARAVFGILLVAVAGFGQTPDGLLKFDTISIKTAGPEVPGRPTGGSDGSAREGHITWFRRNLVGLVMQCYGVEVDQVVGPEWMYDIKTPGTYSYDLSVTMPGDATDQQVKLMMRSLLADRFHLAFHRETRNFPGYELDVADGGPLMKEAAPGTRPVGSGFSGGGEIWFKNDALTMAQFVGEAGRMVRESNGEVLGISVPRVVDKTGLKGIYPIALDFRGWHLLPGQSVTDAQRASVKPEVAKLPDIFGALENQLGLKLVKVADVPLDVLVIDHADAVADGN